MTEVLPEEIERSGDPYAVPEIRQPSEQTYLVNGVRAEVDAWRANGYVGASETTTRLFTFWFEEDHQTPDGLPFQYYFCQREAVETFVFLHEVRGVRSFMDLMPFCSEPVMVDPREQRRARYAFKMATGSGKTKAMALCIAWSYFHWLYELDSPMTRSASISVDQRARVLAPSFLEASRSRSREKPTISQARVFPAAI